MADRPCTFLWRPGRPGAHATLVLLAALLVAACGPFNVPRSRTPSAAACPTPARMPTLADYEDDMSRWGGMVMGPGAQWRLEQTAGSVDDANCPSLDGRALKVSLLGGQASTDIHAYRNLASVPGAQTFTLDLSFWFSPAVDPIQALEFTMSKWVGGRRWEWAVQWENIGDNTPNAGNPPTWRLWTGTTWHDTRVQQGLEAKTWHTLHLTGDIVGGQVHYTGFSCDGISADLGQRFDPVSSEYPDMLAIAIQLDGDAHERPYQVVIDMARFTWR